MKTLIILQEYLSNEQNTIIGFIVAFIGCAIAYQMFKKVKEGSFRITQHWIFIIVIIAFLFIGISLIFNKNWLP